MRNPGGTVSLLALTMTLAAVPVNFAHGSTAAFRSLLALEFIARQDAPQAAVVPPAAAPVQTPARPRLNPLGRDVALTVPLNFNRRVLGELPVVLTRDDRFIVDSAGFLVLISPLLTPEAQAELKATLEGVDSFAPEEINATGIRLDYDPDLLAVLVLSIDPTKRSVEDLFNVGTPEAEAAPPETFSAYLNTNLSVDRRQSTGDVSAPSVFLSGAVRFGGVVLESDVQGREDFFSGDYEIDRQFARFVYDQPEAFRRWFLGDLDPELRGRQGFVQLGGVGVARQRRRFDSFRNSVLGGGRQLVLQEVSTVRVLRNGAFLREFRLDPGQYDVSNLPLETGTNDVQLEIRSDSGRFETVGYSAFLDQIELDPGDYEYGAYFGAVSNTAFGSPDYSGGDPAFTGFYRKAFQNRPAVGVGLQASSDTQVVTGQTQVFLGTAGRLQFDAAGSHADQGSGYAFAISYDQLINSGAESDSWNVVVDYTSEEFSTLGNDTSSNPTSWALSANYSRRLSTDWQAGLQASYRLSRDPARDDSYSLQASTGYRFSPQWSAQITAEYSDFGRTFGGFGGADGFGVTAALVWQPGVGRRADARYRSATNSGTVSFTQSPDNRVGAIGYTLAATYDDGPASVFGQADYLGNRFEAGVSHTVLGESFGSITDEQITSVRFGSSIATAGGKVAIGRNIFDSFAIVSPHPTLDSDVIVGQTLEGGQYIARSSVLGPAVSNALTSYVNQSVQYDAINAPRGYDVGEGILRVFPSYRSGYAIEVGSAAFVSALGRLRGNDDRAVALVSGRVVALGDTDVEPQLFFTNSAGRFAIQGLEPGKRYRIDLFSSPALSYEFNVPADNAGLLDLGIVNVPLDVPQE